MKRLYIIGTKRRSYNRMHGSKKRCLLSEVKMQLLISYIMLMILNFILPVVNMETARAQADTAPAYQTGTVAEESGHPAIEPFFILDSSVDE